MTIPTQIGRVDNFPTTPTHLHKHKLKHYLHSKGTGSPVSFTLRILTRQKFGLFWKIVMCYPLLLFFLPVYMCFETTKGLLPLWSLSYAFFPLQHLSLFCSEILHNFVRYNHSIPSIYIYICSTSVLYIYIMLPKNPKTLKKELERAWAYIILVSLLVTDILVRYIGLIYIGDKMF